MFNVRPIVAICLLLAAPLAALDLDSTYLDQIRRGMDLAYSDRYAEAKTLFTSMIAADTNDYAAYFFLAASYHAEMIDAEDYTDKPIFFALIDTAIARAEVALEAEINPAWAALIIGNAHGYIAAFEGKEGSWWEAIKRGVKAKNKYLKVLEYEPDFYDAYLGLGNYHYWRSVKTEFINWMPFVPDRKEQGLRELVLVRDSSLFSATMAANSLLWIHVRGDRPAEAFETLQWLEQHYPNSRTVLWGEAFVNEMAGRYQQSIEAFGQLIAQIESKPSNYFNLIECRFHRAQMFRLLGQRESALSELESLLSYHVGGEVRKRQEDRLEEAGKLLRELRKP